MVTDPSRDQALESATSPSVADGDATSTSEQATDENPFRVGSQPSVEDSTSAEMPELEDSADVTENDSGDADSGDGDDMDGGDNDAEDFGPRKGWLYWLIVWLLILCGVGALIWLTVTALDDNDDDSLTNQPPATQTEQSDAMASCDALGEIHLDNIGVLRYADSLQHGNIGTLWTGESEADTDAQAVLDHMIDALFVSDGDGCTPQGVAYWRNILPHNIDADRLGVSNHDAMIRIANYTEDVSLSRQVGEEVSRQLEACTDVQFLHLTREVVPTFYVAAYSQSYDDVVFVHSPLLEVDDLGDNQQGLIVFNCTFGSVEGNAEGLVNSVFISPSLRSIVYLDRPTGSQVFNLVNDDVDIEESAQMEEAPAEPEPVVPEETADNEVTQPQTEATSEATVEETAEPEPVVVEETATNEVTQPQTEATSEATVEETAEPEPVVVEETATNEVTQPQTEATSEATVEETAEPEPVVVEETATNEVTQPQTEATSEATDYCPNGCGSTSGSATSDTTGGGNTTGGTTGDTTGGNTGGGDTGNGSGGDSGDGQGSGDGGGDGCSTGTCPGDGNGGGDDPEPEPEPEDEGCPAGWLEDPFGNCKSPDPGTNDF